MKKFKKLISILLCVLMIASVFSAAFPVFAQEVSNGRTEQSEENTCEAPHIVSEIVDKREESVKHFLMSDGSFSAAYYSEPIHYQSENGIFVDYNNSLTEQNSTDEESALFGESKILKTSNEKMNAVFAKKSNAKALVSYEDEKFPLSFGYQSAKNSKAQVINGKEEADGDNKFLSLPNISSQVLYENVFDKVDLHYTVNASGVKENIILKSPNTQNSFTVNYNIGMLNAVKKDKNTIELIDGEKNTVYTISAPVMFDAAGEESNEVELIIEKNKNGKLRICVSADKEWLSAENRTFPVTIDPSVRNVELDSIKRAVVSSSDYTCEDDIILSADSSSQYGKTYALMDFSTIRNILIYERIYSAKLSLPISVNPKSSVRVDAHKITSEWDLENVNWNNKPSFDPLVMDYCDVNANTKMLDLDITKLFMEIMNTTDKKFGVLLKVNNGSMAVSTPPKTPLFTLNYGSSLGVDSSYTYNDFDMGTAGTVYINNLTGNLVILRDEISTAGDTCPYDLTTSYNMFGTNSWKASYQSGFGALGIYNNDDGSMKIYESAGSNGELKENDDGWSRLIATNYKEYKITLFGKEITLLRYPIDFDAWRYDNTEKYVFKNDVGLVSKYIDIDPQTNPNGTLAFSREPVVDANGNAVSGSFYIVDADGKKLKIVKTDSQYIASQIDCDSNGAEIEKNKVIYSYDSNGNVVSIVKNNKMQAAFTYDNLNRITSITDGNNHKLELGYSDINIGVDSITESKNGTVSQRLSIERTYSTSTVRRSGGDGVFGNGDDTFTEYKFDSYDNLASERSYTNNGEDLGAVAYEHDESGKEGLMGTVSKMAASGKIAENLLKNHNMEKDGNWTATVIDDAQCSYEASRTTAAAYSGNSSFKVKVNSTTKTGGAGYYQQFNVSDGVLNVGEYYRLSAYIKTDSIKRSAKASSDRAYGASVMVSYSYADGTSARTYSESVQKTDPDINGGWQRVNIGFEVPEGTTKVTVYLVLRNATGTAYFDACQLEKGSCMSQYNMLENPSFYYISSDASPESWSKYNLSSSDSVVNGKMHINGATSTNKGVFQQVNLKDAKPEDTYVISGIANADAVPAFKDNNKSRFYGIYALVYYKDADGNQSNVQKAFATFDRYYNGKQYTSAGFDLVNPDNPELIPIRIRVVVCFYKQPSEAFFDSIALVRTNDVYDYTSQDENQNESDDTSYTYFDDGRIETYTDENGVVYTYEYYEDTDILLSRLNPGGKGDRYTYSYYDSNGDGKVDAGLPLTESYEDGTNISYTYYANRELKEETTVSDGVTTVLTYNTNGQLITESTTSGGTNKTYNYTYNALGDVLTKLTPDGKGDRYTYRSFDTDGDGIADKSEILTETLEDGSQNSYNYNNDGALIGETRVKDGKTLSFVYDADGNMTSATHNGFTYNYTYDGNGNTKSVKVGNQPLVTYGYQNEGRLASTTYGNGSTESYTYNSYGQLSSINKTGLGRTSWIYDALGRQYYARDNVNARKTYFYYDDNNQTVGQHVYSAAKSNAYDTRMFAINRAFNDNGEMTKEELSAKETGITNTFAYNENGQPSQTVLTSIRSIDYGYDSNDRLKSRTLSSNTPVAETFTYNSDDAVSTHRVSDGTRDNTYSYTYSDNGNITQIKKDNAVIKSYVYDNSNQLVRENDAENNRTVTYSYDNGGNITSKSVYAYTTGTLGTPTSTKNYTYDSTWKDKLTSYGGQSITYDAIGNPTNYMGATMTWFGRQLQSYTKGNTTVTYKYDADGLRTQKIVNGVQYDYFYVDGQLMYEKIGNDCEMFYRYDPDGRLSLVFQCDIADGAKHYYYPVTNSRGDIMEIHNGPGQITAKYNYDAWGKLLSVTDANGNVLPKTHFAYKISVRYRGYEYDAETGLYYLQSRYYDPETGRFINADDAEYIGYSDEDISYNAFAYCENDPVNNSDYNGYRTARNIFTNIGKALIMQMLLNRIKEIGNDKLANRLRNASNVIYNSQKTREEGITRYKISATYSRANFKYYDYYTLYAGSWESWDKYIKKIENNAAYKIYNSTTVAIIRTMMVAIIGVKYTMAGLFLTAADASIGISATKLCYFTKCSRVTLKCYKENNNTDILFIYLAKVPTTIFMKSGLNHEKYGHITSYEGDDGINRGNI